MKLDLVKNIIAKSLTFLFLLVFVFSPLAPIAEQRRAEAIFGIGDTVIEIGANLIYGSLTAAKTFATSIFTHSLVTKEFALDRIGWGLVNVLLEHMIKSTTQWVASGFEGKPYFVQDFEGFLFGVADRYALSFIDQRITQFLCEPFRLNVSLALQVQYATSRQQYQSTCRLTTAIKNFDAFRNGDFIAGGGWGAWFNVSLDPNLQPQGALASADAALRAGINGKQVRETDKLNWGTGFFGKEECKMVTAGGGTNADQWDSFYGGSGGVPPEPKEVCETVTPGQTIQGRLGTALDIPTGRLTIADELDELLGALMTQLTMTLIAGAGGVAGANGGGNNAASAYFDNLAAPVYTQGHNQETDYNAVSEAAQAASAAAVASAATQGRQPSQLTDKELRELIANDTLGPDAKAVFQKELTRRETEAYTQEYLESLGATTTQTTQ